MRTFLIAALLAGVAVPALAARPSDEERVERHHEQRTERQATRESTPRQERSAEHAQQRNVERQVEVSRAPSTGDRADFGARGRIAEPINGQQAVEQMHPRDAADTVREYRGRPSAVETSGTPRQHDFEPKEVRSPRAQREVVAEEPSSDTVRNWHSRERDRDRPTGQSIEERNVRRAPIGSSGGDLVQSKRPVPRVFEQGERRVSRTPVFGTEPPAPRTAGSRQAHAARHWNTDWRHDNRYDWRNWRRHHRSNFHFGAYYDPFGWDYMQYGIGWRLWPNYYRSSFWLNDPWQYRLPPAYGPYRWVRYYNDALLVNIYTGQVVDVEYNFFW